MASRAKPRELQPSVPAPRQATPYLSVRDAPRAIEFYKKVFGAKEVTRLTFPDGKVAHADLRIGNSVIFLADEFPNTGARSPRSLGGSSVIINLQVKDADAVARKAVKAGARIIFPVADQFYGERSGRIEDPFGHLWIISTHKEDVPPEEMRKRFGLPSGN